MVEPLDVHVRLLLNGWVDITGDVRGDPSTPGGITIRSGTSVEGQQPEPGSCTFLLNNCDGRYSPRNPTGPYYGFLGRNTKLQVYVDFPGPTLRSTSSQASGDVEEFTVSAPAGIEEGDVLVAFQGFATLPADDAVRAPAGGSGWKLVERGEQSNGDSRAVAWWKVALDNEPASYTFFNPSGGEAVVSIAAVRDAVMDEPSLLAKASRANTSPTTSVESPGAFPVGLADLELRFAVGIPAGAGVTWTTPAPLTEHEDVNASDAVTGVLASQQLSDGDLTSTLTFTPSGNVNNSVGLTIDIPSRSYRFYGEVSEWPPRGDCSEGNLWVPVTASGVLRRLNQDGVAISSMREFYQDNLSISPSVVWAYWPLEDGSDATAPQSGIAGHPALEVIGDIQFAGSSRLFGSEPVVVIQPGGRLRGPVTGTSEDGFSSSILFAFQDQEPDNGTVLTEVGSSGTAALWRIIYNTGFILSASAFDEDGNLLDTTGTFDFSDYLALHQRFLLRLQTIQSGSDVLYSVNVTRIGDDYTTEQASVGSTVTSATVGAAGSIGTGAGLNNTAVGHMAVGSLFGVASALDEAIIGHFGEMASDRMRRLLSGTGVELYADFGPDIGLQFPLGQPGTVVMGEEGVSTRMNKVREAVESDRGILHEDRERSRLVYRTLPSLYNQSATAPLSFTDLAGPPEPIEDDLLLANDVTVTQRSGSSARAVKEEGALSTSITSPGVGTYSENVQVNVASDFQLPEIANWVLRLGTWDDFRFDRIGIRNLALLECPSNPILTRFALALDPGDVISLDDIPDWLPPDQIRTLVRGRGETLDKYRMELSFSAVPADPYDVGIFQAEGDVPGEDAPARYSSQGSVTASALLLPGSSGDYASTPDTATLDITGDIDLRVDALADDWASGSEQTLIAKYADSASQRSYRFAIDGNGTLRLQWSTDGTATASRSTTVTPTIPLSGRMIVRVTMDVNDGAGNRVITFYTAEGGDSFTLFFGPWTQLEQFTIAGTTSIFSGSADLEVGARDGGATAPFAGLIYRALVYDGIDGTQVASPDFTGHAQGTASFTDSDGLLWTMNGNSSLLGDFAAGTDTTLHVTTLLGPVWTQNQGGDFDIRVSGSRLRVTAIGAPVGMTQPFTVNATPVNGVEKTIDGDSEVELWTPAAYAL